MSIAKSFFDITTGRSHGVIPTSDAVRIVLNSGATLMLDEMHGRTDGVIRARAVWDETGRAPRVDVTYPCPDDDLLNRSFSCVISASGDRVDRALSALVERLLIGESGVEVTEWTIPTSEIQELSGVSFGKLRIPLFKLDGSGGVQCLDYSFQNGDCGNSESRETTLTRLLLDAVKIARIPFNERFNESFNGIMYAIVVRSTDSSMAGIACTPNRPESPIGATLVGRRMIGGKPHIDVPWNQTEGEKQTKAAVNVRSTAVFQAIEQLKIDCEMVGIRNAVPKLSLMPSVDGMQGLEIVWDIEFSQLGKALHAVCQLHDRGSDVEVTTLRVEAVQRTT